MNRALQYIGRRHRQGAICGAGGWMLLEMMVAVSLVALFGLISAKLTGDCIGLMARTGASHDQLLRVQTLLGQMRQDVWSAREVVAIPGGVALTVGEQAIAWTVAGEAIQRSERPTEQGGAAATRTWKEIGGNVAIEPAITGVRVRITGEKEQGQVVEQILVPSQLLVLREASR